MQVKYDKNLIFHVRLMWHFHVLGGRKVCIKVVSAINENIYYKPLINNNLERFSCVIFFITWDKFYKTINRKCSFVLLLPVRISSYHQFLFTKFMHLHKQTVPMT